MKKIGFPKLKKEELQKITGGTTYVDGVPWTGGYYNPGDESGSRDDGRQPRCRGNNPTTGSTKIFRGGDCDSCITAGYINCTLIP